MSDNDSAPAAPFPGVPTSWDLHGHTLTLYYAPDPATGHHPHVEITGTTAWTDTTVREALAEHGVAPRVRPHRAGDAAVTVLAGVIAVGERVAAAVAHLSRSLSTALTGPVAAHGPRP